MRNQCMTNIDTIKNLPRRNLLKAGFLAAGGLFLGGCTRVLSSVSAIGSETVVYEGQSYGPAARHRLDLYLPLVRNSETPIAVFFYGGSWKWGSRRRYGFVGHALASRGIATVVADYRLYPDVRFPAFNHDAALAVRWMMDNRARYDLGERSVHVMGHSAGAHIAASLALDPTYLSGVDLNRQALASVIGLSGPYAMYPSEINFIADIFPRGEAEAAARPITMARADAPPMLLLHGQTDRLVPPFHTRELFAAQRAEGASVQLKLYDNVGHKDIVAAIAPPLSSIAPITDDIEAFIRAQADDMTA